MRRSAVELVTTVKLKLKLKLRNQSRFDDAWTTLGVFAISFLFFLIN